MVDERRVRLLLQRISEDLDYLDGRAASDRTVIRSDVDRMAALKYYLITAIEGCLNVAQHLAASEGWGPPTDNADAMRCLAEHDVLPGESAAALASAVRFRNLLVHEYATIDDDRVVGYLDRVVDLRRFVARVSDWLAGQR